MTKQPTKRTTEPRILVLGNANAPIRDAAGTPVNLGIGDDRAAEAIRTGKIDGLLLTGGGDVDPELYAKKRHPRVYGVNEKRDDAEWNAITAAEEMGIPMMGICRGSQMLNVVFGGTLHQHIQDLKSTHDFHNGGDHRVRAAKGSRLAAAWGSTEKKRTRWVISIHHQAVDQVAPGFVATGWALDGTIEAIEATEGWVVGVQFHPEMDHGAAYHQRLFDRFVAAAAKHRGLPWKLPQCRDGAPDGPSNVLHYGGPAKPSPLAYDIRTDNVWRSRSDQARRQTSVGVLTKWRCFRCTIDFDNRTDHLDHMLYFHGVELT